MSKGRLETFSDAVLAIIITIMVLEMKTPDDVTLDSLRPLVPVFLSYALSFLFIGIYWSNHHHLLLPIHRVTAGVLWGNLHLLFWLSLVPFATRWMGDSGFAAVPTAVYGGVLLLAGIAYVVLRHAIGLQVEPGSTLARVGGDRKSRISLLLYAIGIPLALVRPRMAGVLYLAGVLPWLVPDRRIEGGADR